MARRPSSQRSRSMGEDNVSRRSSLHSLNPNVFSDEYAVDPADSIGAPSPTGSIDDRREELSVTRQDGTQRDSREYIPTGLPGTSLTLNRSSIAKRPLPAESLSRPQRTV